MKIEFDHKRIQKLMIDFYNCTNIPITLFDSEYNCIFGYGAVQPFCTNFRKTDEFLNLCTACDNEHFRLAKDERRTVTYTCHAGVCESVTPIFYDNILIAYLMLGKFRDEEQVYSSPKIVRSHIKSYEVNMTEKLAEYKKLPVISETLLASAVSILKVCIRYIWSENLIKLNKNMLPAQIEDYITENLKSELSVKDICKNFFISKQMLYDLFRTEFNDTVKNYINTKRLIEAKKLLEDTDLSVGDIAEQVGFLEYNYFIQRFKEKMGTTPLQYRKQFRKKK